MSERIATVDGIAWVSHPEPVDRAGAYEILEIRLLGDGDLVVVSPSSEAGTF
jgi:hypothetical protein